MRRANAERQVCCGRRQAPRCNPVDEQLLFDPRRVRPVGLDGDYRVGDHFRGTCPVGAARPADRDALHRFRSALRSPSSGAGTSTRRRLVDISWVRDSTTRRGSPSTVVPFSQHEGDELVQAPIRLVKGWHRLRIRYRAITGGFQAYLYWTPPHRPTSVVPSAFLRPTPKSSEFAFLPTLADTTGELRRGRLREADG